MFTGLVAGQGEIVFFDKNNHQNSHDARLGIKPKFIFENPVLGESVAINGACLTVESFDNGILTFYTSEETLSCSTLGLLSLGNKVNMERALALGDRLGGHLVSGHIDCVGKLSKIQNVGDSKCFRITFSEEIAPCIIPKGSIALDGISLTVNTCDNNFLEVNVIPETWKVTNISLWKEGQLINIETDMIGKYILRSTTIQQTTKNISRIDTHFLHENGFL